MRDVSLSMRDTKVYFKTATTVNWLDNKFNLESSQNSTTTSSGYTTRIFLKLKTQTTKKEIAVNFIERSGAHRLRASVAVCDAGF